MNGILRNTVNMALLQIKYRGYEMNYAQLLAEYDKLNEGSTAHISDLEARIIDLSTKLDQAIDLLTIEQRAALLIEWGKGYG